MRTDNSAAASATSAKFTTCAISPNIAIAPALGARLSVVASLAAAARAAGVGGREMGLLI